MGYKHDYDKALTRLVAILTKLYNGEELSVKELAVEFNVSTRTIQRDFNERLISFPIYQDNRLWKMQEGFKLEKTTSIEDQIVLDIMEKLVDGVGARFSSKAKALLSKIKNEDFNPIYTKLNMEDITDKLDIIQQLESAIKSKDEITLVYETKNDHKVNTCFKPLKIANFEGFWYLIALDSKDNNKIKKYYLKNISSIKTTGMKFTIDAKVDTLLNNATSIWFNEKEKPFEVKIHVSNEISKFIKRKPISPTQMFESINEDGSCVIVVNITHEMEIIPIIKYWLPHMRVLEPSHINETIQKELKEYILDS